MIQYVVPPVALRMKPPVPKKPPPTPQPTELSTPGDPVKTSTAVVPGLAEGSSATCSLLAGVNEYQTLWALPSQDDTSVGSNVACDISRVSWNGRLVITVALLMSSLGGGEAHAGAAVATSSGTVATRMTASRRRVRVWMFGLIAVSSLKPMRDHGQPPASYGRSPSGDLAGARVIYAA